MKKEKKESKFLSCAYRTFSKQKLFFRNSSATKGGKMVNEKGSISANSEIILTIKSHMQQMNPAQTRIARYILENPEKVE